jgi:hypothetical protein
MCEKPDIILYCSDLCNFRLRRRQWDSHICFCTYLLQYVAFVEV